MTSRSVFAGVLLAAALTAAGAIAALASVDRSAKIPAVRAPQPLLLDASLSDPAWKTGTIATDFENFTSRSPAKYPTVAYVLYDDANVYVAFHCEQLGLSIVATQTTNDVGEGLDDYVEVGFDPSGNGTRSYQFLTTAKGVRYQHSSESNLYKPPWQSAARIDGTSWNAVLIIPLKDLRASPGAWRINLSRHISSINEDLTWAYGQQMDLVTDSAYWPQWTGLVFKASAARPKPRADIFGLASEGPDRNVFPQLNGTAGPTHARHIGGDGVYPISDTLALVGTLNPDFSNVEADQQTITPQQFQRVLNEYRPFFAQGQAFLTPDLSFSVNGPANIIFYTPSIGSFNAGLKAEGTARLNALGALTVTGPGFTDTAFGFNHRTSDTATRYFFNGVIAHHSNNDSSVTPCPFVNGVQLPSCVDSTFEAGTRISSLKTGQIEAIELASESGDYVPDAAKGHTFLVYSAALRPFWGYALAYRDVQPYFAPVDGFTLINDIRGPGGFLNFSGNGKPGSAVKSWNFGFGAERYIDHTGAAHYAETNEFANVLFKDLLNVSGGPNTQEIRQYDIGYPAYVNGQTFAAHTSFAGLNYRDGTPQSIDASWTWGPSSGFLAPGGVAQAFYSSFYFQEFDIGGAAQLTPKWNLSAGYSGDRERCYFTGCDIQQSLRRVSLGRSFGPNSGLSLALRTISGTGYAPTAANFAVAFHQKYPTGNELYVEYGTPQTTTQLYRYAVKYVYHIGGGAGT